ncbi:hypothetical protein [Polymorphospora rubra]|uniref:Uncharacterized protein n=1 Tax=Polymorphospora rubra TaxID=338584 RepID=A0A810N213_9ACTN|nr:hypothetical protein [Polymorphospora rubra]BCJ65793.1 hypothetical protein Prubr_28140 [Polymorphospora rubra]
MLDKLIRAVTGVVLSLSRRNRKRPDDRREPPDESRENVYPLW